MTTKKGADAGAPNEEDAAIAVALKSFAFTVLQQAPRGLAVVLLGVSGWLWSIGDADAFQRLGSLFVFTGLALATVFPNRLDEVERDLDAAFGVEPDDDESDIQALRRAQEAIAKRVAYRVTLRRVEVFLVLIGTLIWGYGDLFVSWSRAALGL